MTTRLRRRLTLTTSSTERNRLSAVDSEENLMEKVYKTMRNAGACSIVIGSVMIVTGLAAGVMAIVSGAALLRRKSEITF